MAAKQAAFKSDEWAKINAYIAFMAKEDGESCLEGGAGGGAVTRGAHAPILAPLPAAEDKAQRWEEAARKRAVGEALAAQVEDSARRRAEERAGKAHELEQTEAEVAAWRAEEAARRAAQRQAQERVKVRGGVGMRA